MYMYKWMSIVYATTMEKKLPAMQLSRQLRIVDRMNRTENPLNLQTKAKSRGMTQSNLATAFGLWDFLVWPNKEERS